MDLHDSFAIIEDENLINDGLIPLIGPLINHVPYPKNFSFPRLPSKEFKPVLIGYPRILPNIDRFTITTFPTTTFKKLVFDMHKAFPRVSILRICFSFMNKGVWEVFFFQTTVN